MDPAHASAPAPTPVAFEDGLGTRQLAVDRSRNETVEMLCLRGELTGVPSFEFALRERLSHLAAFSHACYGRVRSVERLKDPASTLALVSDVTAGMRLSEILRFAEAADVTLDIDAALCLLRQLVPAVAMLHENMPDISHGAIGPERLIVTPGARLIVVEHVMGSALEQLRFSQERYWRELRIAVPRSAGLPRFDHRADVTQLGVVALSLILGRRLQDDEGPSRLGDLVSSAWAVSARGGLEPLPAGLRAQKWAPWAHASRRCRPGGVVYVVGFSTGAVLRAAGGAVDMDASSREPVREDSRGKRASRAGSGAGSGPGINRSSVLGATLTGAAFVGAILLIVADLSTLIEIRVLTVSKDSISGSRALKSSRWCERSSPDEDRPRVALFGGERFRRGGVETFPDF